MRVSGSMVQRKRTPMCILKKVIKNENNKANASVWNMISRTWIDRYTLHPSWQRGSRKIQSSCVLFGITHLNWTEDEKETYHANNGKAGTALFICFYLPFLSYCFKNMSIIHCVQNSLTNLSFAATTRISIYPRTFKRILSCFLRENGQWQRKNEDAHTHESKPLLQSFWSSFYTSSI